METLGDKNYINPIIEYAINLGASVAGIANVDALKKSPSHFIFGKLDRFDTVGRMEAGKVAPGQIDWPANAGSAIVVGVEHPEDKPELDWWHYGLRGGTPGNQILMDINAKLSEWLEKKKGYKTRKLPYYIENGGIFLKDAATLAGLGCIGKNNLFVNPDYGPRIRLRAIILDAKLFSTGAYELPPI
jgi:epoxyqueuosine reductase